MIQVGIKVELKDYSINNVTEGIEALAITKVAIIPLIDLKGKFFKQSPQGRLFYRTFLGDLF